MITNNIAFKGSIIVPGNKNEIHNINADYIKKIEADYSGTNIEYYKLIRNDDAYQTKLFKGHTLVDINTILNAYNATKNSQLEVDLTNYTK